MQKSIFRHLKTKPKKSKTTVNVKTELHKLCCDELAKVNQSFASLVEAAQIQFLAERGLNPDGSKRGA